MRNDWRMKYNLYMTEYEVRTSNYVVLYIPFYGPHKYCSLIVVVLDEILLTGQLRHIRFLWSHTNPAWRCFSIHKGRRAEAGILGHITLSLN